MDNIISYAEKQFELFDENNFNSVDSLILSWVSYMHLPASVSDISGWNGTRLADLFLGEHFGTMFQGIWDELSSRRLFTALAASPRFRDVRVKGFTEQFDPEAEKQFAAVSFQLTPTLCYIAFRGTDSTLVGWKEDFNMAFRYPVPAQFEAAKYLTEAAANCTGNILVGGHSKGRNLAVYAAFNCPKEVQNRIVHAYSHDGPGFSQPILESEAFLAVRDKIEKTIPQSSLVGMLFEQQENTLIIKSTRYSVWQHDPFSWAVEGNDFCRIEQLTSDARYLDQTLDSWLRSLSDADRERFVDSLYEILTTTTPSTLSEISSNWKETIPAIFHAASELDEDTRAFLIQTLKALTTLGLRNVPELFQKS